MKAADFKIRERLECVVRQNGREVHFLVRVQDIETGRLRVDQPIVDQHILHLEVGTNLRIHFHRPDGSYEFESYIIGKDQINMPCLILAEPQNVVRCQRREYYRVDTSIDVDLTSFPPTNGEKSTIIKGEIINISAGGAKIRIGQEDYRRYGKRGDQLQMNFELPTRIEMANVVGEIVNLQKFPDDISYLHVRFVNITDVYRKEIVVFNFHRQRDHVKRISGRTYYRPQKRT